VPHQFCAKTFAQREFPAHILGSRRARGTLEGAVYATNKLIRPMQAAEDLTVRRNESRFRSRDLRSARGTRFILVSWGQFYSSTRLARDLNCKTPNL